MPKFSPIQLSKLENKHGFSFMCPGCKENHFIQVNPEFSPCWTFNNDVDKPTVSPSIRVRYHVTGGIPMVCHSFITSGFIQFCNDSTHKLSGLTVELPEWD